MAKPRRKNSPPRDEQSEVRVPAGAPRWVTAELIEHTLRVWQRYYDHPLTAKEALEIILNTGRMVEALTDDDLKHPAKASDQDQSFDSWLESW